MDPKKWLRVMATLVIGALVGSGLASPPAMSEPSPVRAVSMLPLPGKAEAPVARPSKKLAGKPSQVCKGGPRSIRDRRDIRKDWVVHVVYVVASNATDLKLDSNGTIECSMQAQQQWMKKETGLQWRLDTFRHKRRGRKAVELVDVSFLRSARSSTELSDLTVVKDELKVAGFDVAKKHYLVYVAGGGPESACGWGDYFHTASYTEPNYREVPKYAVILLLGPPACHAMEFGVPGKPSWTEMIAQQEIMHTDGIVPIGAPHGCFPGVIPAHVCTAPFAQTPGLDPERFDVMFPYAVLPLSEKKVDIGNDDYFRTAYPLTDLEDSLFLDEV